jgi:hypothetical protein
MAAQTKTQRQATAKKAAATRKRNAAKRGSQSTKASARRTASSARGTSRAARSTAKQATRTTEAEVPRLEAVARQAERALLIPVGAALEARDTVVETARTYGDRARARRQLNRFERRGATALGRNRRSLERQVKDARRNVEPRANGIQADAESAVERVRSLA